MEGREFCGSPQVCFSSIVVVRSVESFSKFFLYIGRVDFRKWIDGLSAIVQFEMNQSIAEESLYVFVSNCRRKIKIIYWDKTGYAVWYKRLEKEKFPRVTSPENSLTMHMQDLKFFLEGSDFTKLKTHKKMQILQNN